MKGWYEMSKIKVGINGFGRIGRLVLRSLLQYDKEGLFEVVATNDLTSPEQRAYMFKYDSVHRRYPGEVTYDDENIIVDGKKIKVLSVRDTAELPWKDLGVDLVVESTGLNTTAEKASKHLEAGAKKVLISAPGNGEGISTIVMGVNENTYDPSKHNIISNASCTTNCLAPIVKVLNDEFGIEKGLMTTAHSYTNDQKTVDSLHSKLHRGRAAAMSIIPTTTGAAKAIGLVIPEMNGKLNGLALRVPTPDVSVVDLVVESSKKVSAEEVNNAFKKHAEGDLSGYLYYETADLVSMDFVGDDHSAIFAAPHTMVIDNMIKVIGWYDNEWGYSCRIIDLINYVIRKGL
jgi:glyceraldehyde 3-phosphate dehydrogenase